MACGHRITSMTVLASSWALLLCACTGGNLLEPVDTSMTLLEFETRMLQVRYTDDIGFGIQAATCSFKIVGPSNGAMVDPRVGITDAQGYCRVNLRVQHAAAFKVVVDSDGADEPKPITVTVSSDAGGVIETLIANTAAATVLSAEVRVMEDFDCSELDAWQPPAPTTFAANPRQLVGVQPGLPTELKTFGLKANQPYTVVAIGYAEDQTRAAACQQNIVISAEQIKMRRAYPLTLNLEDLSPDPTGNTLNVISQFKGELGLKGVAALLRQMSDSQYDPVDYVLSQMAVKKNDFVTKLITAYRPLLVEAMSYGGSMSSGRESLSHAAASLASVTDIELHTLMEITDDDEAAALAQQTLTVDHQFRHFTAEINGHREQLNVHPSRPVFDSTLTPKLVDRAQLTVENAETVHISEHHMTVPMADAIVGKVLMDQFADYRIDKIVTAMIDCSRAGELVAGSLPGSDGLIGIFLDPAKRILVNDMCQDVVGEMVEDIYDQIKVDLEDYRWDQQLTFTGRASMELLPDGAKVNRLVNGEWTDIGIFSAKRQ